MSIHATLARVRDDLDELRVTWGLVGGLAVSVRAEPRFTRDIDVAVAVDDDRAADSLVMALHRRGYVPYASMDQLATGRLATERLWSGDDPGKVSVDLLFSSSGIEPEVAAASERLEVVPGLVLPVATSGHLLVLKLLSRDADRPRDDQDLVHLRQVLSPADLRVAREAASLIMARGTHRGRDLPALLADLLSTSGGA